MRWNKIKMAMALITTLVLGGCVSENVTIDKEAREIKPFVTILSDVESFRSIDVFYLIDDRTGVVYLGFNDSDYTGGITVMLNSDGTPITYDQIKEEK